MALRLPATTIIVTNAILFANPFQALAETCEADNSVFNMNMPLLLFFSLIGATVGGKLLLLILEIHCFLFLFVHYCLIFE